MNNGQAIAEWQLSISSPPLSHILSAFYFLLTDVAASLLGIGLGMIKPTKEKKKALPYTIPIGTHIPQIHFDLSTISAPSGGVDSMDKSTL